MSSSDKLETKWQTAAGTSIRDSALVNEILYICNGDDIIGYNLETGRAETRITDVGVKRLAGTDKKRLLAGMTEDSIVAIDPRSEQVRWRWDDLWKPALKTGQARIASTDDDLYVLATGNPEEVVDSRSGPLILVRFSDFTDNTSRQKISRPRDHGNSAPLKIGPLKTNGEWVYTHTRGTHSNSMIDHLIGWHSIQNSWTVDMQGRGGAFDTSDETIYVTSGESNSQSRVEAYDAETGARMWSAPTPDTQCIVATAGGTVIGGQFGLIALNETDGAVAWENPEYSIGGIAADDGTLFTTRIKNRTSSLSVFDFEDGSLVAETEFEGEHGGRVTLLEDAVTVLASEQLIGFERPKTGIMSGSATEPDQTQSAATQHCSSCGNEVSASASFCSNCGTTLEATACPDCGVELEGDEQFCPQCGTNLDD
jgi:outer membrane protein assembly factor BamB